MAEPDASKKHVAVGNLNLDISVVLDSFPSEDTNAFANDAWIGLGGAATNYAVAVSRLGHGSILVARTGFDAVKLGILDRLGSLGIDTSRIVIAPGEPMGIVVVLLVPSSSTRTMITIRGANTGLRPEHVPHIEDASVYHLASVRPHIIAGLCGKRWWRQGFTVSYDPGGEAHRSPKAIAELLGCIDILFANTSELGSIARAVGAGGPGDLLSLGPHLVVVKNGRNGARLYTPDTVIEARPASPVRPVDVTGAGDAFDAAFNVWLLETGSLEVALRAAVAAGTLKVLRKGSSNMPSRREVEKYMLEVKVRQK